MLTAVDREVRVGSKKIDVTVEYAYAMHWIELKHWLIGTQRGYLYGPSFYFGDRTSVGIIKDVERLTTLDVRGSRWLFVLLTVNPGVNAWIRGLDKFNEKYAPFRLHARSSPSQFPPTYFLGLLEVQPL